MLRSKACGNGVCGQWGEEVVEVNDSRGYWCRVWSQTRREAYYNMHNTKAS